MNKLIITFSISLLSIFSLAQDISGNKDWKTEKDFKKSEKQVVENILWLEENPNIDNEKEGQAVYAYVLTWAMNCPYINVELDSEVLSEIYSEDYTHSALMTISFLFGKVLYAIENEEQNTLDSDYRGIVGMINTYNSIIKVKGDAAKSETMEKFKNLLAKGELKASLEEQE